MTCIFTKISNILKTTDILNSKTRKNIRCFTNIQTSLYKRINLLEIKQHFKKIVNITMLPQRPFTKIIITHRVRKILNKLFVLIKIKYRITKPYYIEIIWKKAYLIQ